MTQQTFKSWALVALSAFLIASLLGVWLRYAFVGTLPDWIAYKNLQHAHSHVAMMGWLYSALYLLIVYRFNLTRKVYVTLFWLTQVAVVGMLCSFPFQGYGLYSIFFTTCHLILSYLFIIQVFRDLRKSPEKTQSRLLLKSALWFLFISTLGTWALGAMMNSSLRGTAWYYGVIQFFLHFQFNGWFVFAVLAILFKFLEDKGILIKKTLFRNFYLLLVISCIFTYALAVTWSTPDKLIFWTNSLGVLIQMFALITFWLLVLGVKDRVKQVTTHWAYGLWILAFLLFSLKIIIQTLVAIPHLAVVSYTIRNFVVGFVHLLMLGVLTVFIMGAFHEVRRNHEKQERLAVYLFLGAFFATEILLFVQGLMFWLEAGFMPWYYELILIASALFPVALIMYIINLAKSRVPGTSHT
jgi:hypothetical protein